MEALLKVEDICKEFGATKALSGVSLEILPGEVRGLLGENGSGKSTLSNIIAGLYGADSGKMAFEGREYRPEDIQDAGEQGIFLLAQETDTIVGMTVYENMFLGRERRGRRSGMVDRRALCRETEEILRENGLDHIRPEDTVERYSFEERKMIEVARAVHRNPKILIIDETTTALSHSGREKIYEIIARMKREGNSILFISHDLDEIMEVCDSVTILRDGCYMDTLQRERMSKEKIRSLMIGRELAGSYYRADWQDDYGEEVLLRAEHIHYKNILRDVSIVLHKGEILGIGGLTESGMHELCKVLFGAIRPDAGEVVFQDGTKILSPQTALQKKIAYIPKDRDTESLFIAADIRDNIVAASYDKLKKHGFISPKAEKRLAESCAELLQVKMRHIGQQIGELSGGNKQKAAICKWLANDSEIFLMDCPTRGIDVGVKANIYRLMEDLKKQGKSIVMVSEELTELIGMSDRIVILKDGMCNGEFFRRDKPGESELIRVML